MQDNRIKHIAIVGGGTAGWIAASVLARTLPEHRCGITVVESAEIPTVGVGEATIPPIVDLLRFLNIDEADFISYTQATFKLAIKFEDWREVGHSYWHPFGTFGATIDRRPFYHYLNAAHRDSSAQKLDDFSICAALAEQGRFKFPDAATNSVAAGIRYAFHFDAGLVARYLRAFSEQHGVKRLEGTVATVTQTENGFIDALHFKDGGQLKADLYIDCSGFRGLLIEQTLRTGYIDWSSLLPCDRAVAVPTASSSPRAPFTLSRAQSSGWRWRIPLQQRVGNGYVFSSAYLREEQALEDLLNELGEKPLMEPRHLRFTAGRRKRFWNANCVALGLASGFLEPLESTSIQLVISGVYNLLEHFPDLNFDAANIDSYNAELIEEIERIRDFIVLHYCTTRREDSELWRYCKHMDLPDSLRERIDLYRGTGRIRPGARELFTDLSWYYIFAGMSVTRNGFDPLVPRTEEPRLREFLSALKTQIAQVVHTAPPHDSYFAPGSKFRAEDIGA